MRTASLRREANALVRVLLIEDDPDDFMVTSDLLDELSDHRYQLQWIADYDDGIEALRRGDHEICLLDHRLGERTGLDLLRTAIDEGHTTPIILLTGAESGELEQEALSVGAADYLVKGRLDAETLWRALRHALERNRALEEMRERERLFRAVFDAAGDAMLIANDAGQYVDGNPAAMRLFQVSRRQLLRLSYHDLGAPTAASELQAAWGRFLADGSQQGEWELVSHDGEVRTVEFRATANILPHRHLSVLRDITERRRAEDTRVQLAAIVEGATDAIISKTLDGTIQQWNSGAERTYGWTEAEAVGRCVSMLVPPDRMDEWEGIQRALGRGEQIANLETIRVRKDGALIEVSLTISPLRNNLGELVGASAVGREVTETNALRTRLAISDRMASVGTLAAGLAHEINNPLAALIANLQLAAKEAKVAEGRLERHGGCGDLVECLTDSVNAAGRVRDIVRDLKLFSSPSAVQGGPVDVAMTMESTLRMVRNEIRHRARVVRDFSPTPLVDAHEGRLGQVFLNLLINAAQAIPEGNAAANEIWIRTYASGTNAVIEISDTGVGIAPAALSRVFEPFYTTKAPGVGTGLGLSICHGIVTDFGGALTVESEVGRGTTFRVTLPLAKDDGAEQEREPVAAVLPLRRSGKILLVDDEAVLVKTISRLLGKWHEVTCVTEAEEALNLIRGGHPYDVVVCDIIMPQMTGMDFFEHIARDHPVLADHTIFMTGGAFTERASQFLEHVRNECLTKPFEDTELLDAIDRLLA